MVINDFRIAENCRSIKDKDGERLIERKKEKKKEKLERIKTTIGRNERITVKIILNDTLILFIIMSLSDVYRKRNYNEVLFFDAAEIIYARKNL